MKINTLLYSIKQGLRNIVRNKMFSLASIGTMIACLFLFGVFLSIVINIEHMVKKVENSVSVTVFFNEGLDQTAIDEIGNNIKKRAEVESIKFISADEAWANFSQEMFDGNDDLIAGFGEDNPLANSASYEIKVNDVSMQNDLVKYIKTLDGVRKVNNSEVTANSLTTLNKLVGYASVGVITILLLVSIFLISNTVTIGISVRKEEIAIMKLIGATDFFVRAPFIVEGIIIGLVGALIPVLLLLLSYNKVTSYIADNYKSLVKFVEFVPAGNIFSVLVPVCLGIGVGVGFLGSFVTIRKHLKV